MKLTADQKAILEAMRKGDGTFDLRRASLYGTPSLVKKVLKSLEAKGLIRAKAQVYGVYELRQKRHNGLLSNLRAVKTHDKRAIQGAALKGRLEAIDAQIRDVTVDPFYKREKGLQGLALRRLKERRREIQAQMRKNPATMTENQAAWRKGYEHGYKGLNSRPDYPKVGLAGSYRLGYEAGEQRRKGKAQPRKNPNPVELVVEFKDNRGNWGATKRVYKTIEAAMKAARSLEKQHPGWIVQIAERKSNPKREAKTSKDAFGVTHENPARKPKFKIGSMVYSYQNPDYKARVSHVQDRGPEYGYHYKLALKDPGGYSHSSHWIAEKSLSRQKLNPSVTAIAEKFQGGVDGAIEEFHAASSAPANLARAGKLVFLKVGAKTFRLPTAMVAIAPNEKLWIVSKRAPVFSTKAKPGEGLDVGEITQICYETAKAHIGDGKRFEYVHEFGEDGGKRPHLVIDHEGMPILHGGDYKIRAEGIVD